MRTCHLVLVLPLLAAATFAQEDKAKAKPKSKILVINMLRTIDESDEGRAVIARLREEMATQKQRYGDEMTKLQEKVKQLRDAKPQDRTPEYYKELEEAMATNARLEMEKNIFMAKKGDELSRALQGLLQGAQQEARMVMKERGADIVLLTKTGPLEVVSDQDFQQELLMRRVLCFDESIDITDDVIARMNDWYKKNKSAQGAPKREGEAEKGGKEPAKETPDKVKDTEKAGG
jgi:Skp family chaperone for outer membrane proteins